MTKSAHLVYFDKYIFSYKCNLKAPSPSMLEKGKTLVLIILPPKCNSKTNFKNFTLL